MVEYYYNYEKTPFQDGVPDYLIKLRAQEHMNIRKKQNTLFTLLTNYYFFSN